jgi:hypothetical protein
VVGVGQRGVRLRSVLEECQRRIERRRGELGSRRGDVALEGARCLERKGLGQGLCLDGRALAQELEARTATTPRTSAT